MIPIARALVALADPGREVQARGFIAAIAAAEAQARADHERGVCHLSEWSCSPCQEGES